MDIEKLSAIDVLVLLDDEGQGQLDGVPPPPPPPKKRGRPPSGATAKGSAARQRDLRNSYTTAIYETPSDAWTDATCQFVLAGSKWRGTPIDEQAWIQLGKLRGFIKTVTKI